MQKSILRVGRLILLSLFIISISANSAVSQDIHFSQFYASPLTLNPALTGLMNAHYRATAIYRNQWRSINKQDPSDLVGEFDPSTSFVTYAGSFDIQPLYNIMKKDIFGVGATFYYDKAGNGGLGTMSAMLSTAYHKRIGGGTNNHMIGLGLQFGYVQKSITIANLVFPSMYDPSTGEFNIGAGPGETFGDENFGYFDLGAGLNWQSNFKEKYGVYAGFSVFHLTTPTESFLNQENSLDMRFVGNAGTRIGITDNIFISPNMIFMMQGDATEVNLGASFEYHIPTDTDPIVLGAGGWYRLGDAAIVSLSMEIKRIRIGAAYDITVSDLSPATNNNSAFEISLIYMGNFSGTDAPVVVPCPRM